MRELKFRVWMVGQLSSRMIKFDLTEEDLDLRKLVRAKRPIMQYTGLKDKLGNDIYEGDLLRDPAGVTAWDENNFTAYEVFYDDNDCADRHVGFQMNRVHFQGNVAGTSQFPGFLPKNTEQMVVIGNIYENKELLK